MFLSCCSPAFSKMILSLPSASSLTRLETQMPPDSARPSRRTATLTPSPKMSPRSTMMSPDVYADAELDPLLLRHIGITLNHAALDIHGTTHRVHDTAELSQQPVSGVLDDTSTVFGDLGKDKGAQMVRELGVCPLFIQASQPAVSSHIGCEDCG